MGFDERSFRTIEVDRVCRVTERAVGVRLPGEKPGGELHWIPQSQIEPDSLALCREGAVRIELDVAEWFADKEGL